MVIKVDEVKRDSKGEPIETTLSIDDRTFVCFARQGDKVLRSSRMGPPIEDLKLWQKLQRRAHAVLVGPHRSLRRGTHGVILVGEGEQTSIIFR